MNNADWYRIYRGVGCKNNNNRDLETIKRLINNGLVPSIEFNIEEIEILNDDYILEINIEPKTDSVVYVRDSENVYLRQSDSTDNLNHN